MNLMTTSFGPSPRIVEVLSGKTLRYSEAEGRLAENLLLGRKVHHVRKHGRGEKDKDCLGMAGLCKAEGHRKGLPPSAATTAEKYEAETPKNPSEADDFLASVPGRWTEQRTVIERATVGKSKALKIIAALESRGDVEKRVGKRYDGKGGIIAYVRKSPVYPKDCKLFDHLTDEWQYAADLCQMAGVGERFKASQARKLCVHPDVEHRSIRLTGQRGIRKQFRRVAS